MLAAALSILAGGAAPGMEASSTYPLEPVWQAFVAYCADPHGAAEGWNSARPEPDSVLDYLSNNRVVPSALPAKFPVSSQVVTGRTLYGIKREWDNPSIGKRFQACEVYDLDLRSDVDLSALTTWSGSEPKVENREHERTITWDRGFAPSQDGARVTLHLPGRFPGLDQVNFVGLRFSTHSSESL